MTQNGLLDKVVSVRVHTRYVDTPRHDPDYIEAVHVIKGSITELIDGKKKVIDEGELLFVNRHSRQDFLETGENDLAISAAIHPDFFDLIRNKAGEGTIPADIMKKVLTDDSERGEYLHFRAGEIESIQNLLDSLIHSLIQGERNPGRDRQEEVYRTNQKNLEMVFLYLLKNLQYAKMPGISHYENMVAMSALDYIEHCYQHGSLTDLCNKLDLPLHSMSRLIKKITGYNFKELLQRKRLFKAVMLLCDTSMTINEIVQAVGYENNSYFYSVFKERYHTTPRDFRFRNYRNRLIRV